MATNNLYIPDDLLGQAQSLAASQGRTADELAADALKRYLAHEWLNKLDREGNERRRRTGLNTDEDVERHVEQLISSIGKNPAGSDHARHQHLCFGTGIRRDSTTAIEHGH